MLLSLSHVADETINSHTDPSVVVGTTNIQAGPEDHVDLKMVRENIVLNIL